MRKGTTKQILTAYRKLHDGLSDMIEEGRLTMTDIPNDYDWLVTQIVALVDLDPEENNDT